MKTLKTCCLYARVSKADKSQDPKNQLEPLRKWADSLGFKVVKEYVDYMSGGASNRPQFQTMMNDTRLHKFDCCLVWSLDRFSREGIRNTLSYLEKLKRNNVAIKSYQESFIDTSNEGVGEVIIALLAWVAKQERQRISERTKAGLVVAKANGKLLGRKQGSRDKRKRKNVGYLLRWEKEKVKV